MGQIHAAPAAQAGQGRGSRRGTTTPGDRPRPRGNSRGGKGPRRTAAAAAGLAAAGAGRRSGGGQSGKSRRLEAGCRDAARRRPRQNRCAAPPVPKRPDRVIRKTLISRSREHRDVTHAGTQRRVVTGSISRSWPPGFSSRCLV